MTIDRAGLAKVFPLLALFTYEHLPPHLQEISRGRSGKVNARYAAVRAVVAGK